jgi:hypothetical protein
MPEPKRQYFISKMNSTLPPQGDDSTTQEPKQPHGDSVASDAVDSPVPERLTLRRKLSSTIINMRRSRNATESSIDMLPFDAAESDNTLTSKPQPPDAGRSERGILNYERISNPLLVALRERADLRDLTQFAEDIKVMDHNLCHAQATN